jgi:hypothetical protein
MPQGAAPHARSRDPPQLLTHRHRTRLWGCHHTRAPGTRRRYASRGRCHMRAPQDLSSGARQGPLPLGFPLGSTTARLPRGMATTRMPRGGVIVGAAKKEP